MKIHFAILILMSMLSCNANPEQKPHLDHLPKTDKKPAETTSNENASAQKLIKDLDLDGIKDTVYFETETLEIVCRLSTQNFSKIKSKPVESASATSASLNSTKSGFEFQNYHMREGYTCQFRFDKSAQKMQLIGMTRYNDGTATLDGSGESSINLLTNNYIGNWNYFNEQANNGKGELVKIPILKTKMYLGKIYLGDFSEAVYDNYYQKCFGLFEQSRHIDEKNNQVKTSISK